MGRILTDDDFPGPGQEPCGRMSLQRWDERCALKPGHLGLCLFPNEPTVSKFIAADDSCG